MDRGDCRHAGEPRRHRAVDVHRELVRVHEIHLIAAEVGGERQDETVERPPEAEAAREIARAELAAAHLFEERAEER